ncbi:MAG: hypothetical protein KDD76_06760, partial [Rickettsiales bacterium]|nr:hypothetical protein [Rickettsiales bacterium]
MSKSISTTTHIFMAADARHFTVPDAEPNANVWTLRYKILFDQDPEFWSYRANQQLQAYASTIEQTVPNVQVHRIPAPFADSIYVADPLQTVAQIFFRVTDNGSVEVDTSKSRISTVLSHFGLQSREHEVAIFANALADAIIRGDVPATLTEGAILRNEAIESHTRHEGNGNNYPDPFRGILWVAEGSRFSAENPKEIEGRTGLISKPLRVKEDYYHVDTLMMVLGGGHLAVLPSAFRDESAYTDFLKTAFPDGKGGINEHEKENYLIEIPETLRDSFIMNTSCIGNNVFMPYNNPAGRMILYYKQNIEALERERGSLGADEHIPVETFFREYQAGIEEIEHLFASQNKTLPSEEIVSELKGLLNVETLPATQDDAVPGLRSMSMVQKVVAEYEAFRTFAALLEEKGY